MRTKTIHIIGPYNTGTNLIHNIIKNCHCKYLITNDSVVINYNPFDKHTI